MTGQSRTTPLLARLERSHPDTLTDDEILALWREAAREIERLRAENTILRGDLGRLLGLADVIRCNRARDAALEGSANAR